MEAAAISAGQPQCQFFVVRKKRLCRMTVRPSRQYCGEHEPQPVTAEQEVDKRVPCPNDPKHTCYVSKLEKHLTKCNARQTKDPPYIIRNINTSEDEEFGPRLPLKEVSLEILQQVIEKVNFLYEKHVKSTICAFSPASEHHSAVAACIAQEDRANSSRRHLRQASRLMQLMEAEGLVGDNMCLVELGAGKGMLSYYMCRAWCDERRGTRVLCVDRASLRHKRDNLVPGRATRLRADLRHLALELTPAVQAATAVLGVAKHLCGVASDYALRCMTGSGVVQKSRGVVLATCCHHRCERPAYVGEKALREIGITGEELNIMFGIVSWATCGDGRSRERRLAENGTGEGDGDIDITDMSEREISIDASRRLLNSDKSVVTENNMQIYKDSKETDANQLLSNKDSYSRTDQNSFKNNIYIENNKNRKESDTNQLIPERDGTNKECHINTDNQQISSTDVENHAPFHPLPVNVREEIGRRAKTLIDYGRVLYLREKGFEARLCYYVPTTESLENVCIVAKKQVL